MQTADFHDMVFPKFGEQELVRSPLNTHCSQPYVQLLAVGVNKEQREGEGKQSIDKHMSCPNLRNLHGDGAWVQCTTHHKSFCRPGVPRRFGPATSVRGGCVSGPPLASERGAFPRVPRCVSGRAPVRFVSASDFRTAPPCGAFSESGLRGASSESDLSTARSVPRIRFLTALLREASSKSDLSTALPPTNPNP